MQCSQNDDTPICPNPFCFVEIQTNGEVYPCCPNWCHHYSFGNIIENSLEDILNGEKAVNFRKKILSGDYSLCKKDLCTYYACTQDKKWLNKIKENYVYNTGKSKIRELKMSWDTECNVACITCRDDIKRNTEQDYENLEKIKNNLLPYIQDLEVFSCSGSGDPFASKYCRDLIKDIAKTNDNIMFGIHTNGILATESMFEKLGIKNKINRIEYSIHAATEETYNKIVKYGNFKKVMENLKWYAKHNKKVKAYQFILTFVINNYNYKEIPDFIKLADKLGAKPCFYYYRYWGTKYGEGEHFKEIAVWKPEHPQFNDFIKVINSSLVKNYKSYSHADFMNLINSDIKPKQKNNLLKNIISLFCK